jgi:hypothetical protein
MPTHKMFSASSTINVYNLIHIETSLIINFSPTNALAALSRCFCPYVNLLLSDRVVVTFLGLLGGGDAIGALLHPLDLLINVIATPFVGSCKCYPLSFDLNVIRDGVPKPDSWALLSMGMLLDEPTFLSFVGVL